MTGLSPLGDLRVVDFSHAVAGPYCTSMLADLGAQVDKVESPHGDHFRPVQGGAIYANVNRNKRSVVLDLTDPEAIDAALRLCDRADVVVESFVPGTAERLGIGYETVRARNGSVIYVSVSGFGQTGPYRERGGYDVVAQAMSGLMAATGPAGGDPVRVGTSAIDYGTGAYAAFTVLAALRERDHTGEGCLIDVALLDTAVVWMSYWYTYYGATGRKPTRMGTAHEMFAPYQVFDTSDGQAFIGVSTDRFFDRFCSEFGLDELALDPRFSSAAARVEHRDDLVRRVSVVLGQLDTSQVLARMAAIGVPAAPVLEVDEVLADPHLNDRGTFQPIDDAACGTVVVPPFPVVVDGQHVPAGRRAPTHGEHTAEVLAEVGVEPSTIQRLTQSSGS